MSVKKKSLLLLVFLTFLVSVFAANNKTNINSKANMLCSSSLTSDAIARQLGWVNLNANFCGGYYLEAPSIHSLLPENEKTVAITSQGGFLSQRTTSVLEGNVTITRAGQEITANRAYLYREPITGKIRMIDMIGDVHLNEAHGLVIGKKGRYDFKTTSKSLIDVIYRTSLDTKKSIKQHTIQTVRVCDGGIANLTAWGKASEFSQRQPRVYELFDATYTTCSPINPMWGVRASHIVLNKNTGRGYATHTRVLIKNVPVLYLPYISFSIDKQRKTGFLWPSIGISNKWGPYLLTPFYWNFAPNYDMTITPGILTKRGFQFNDDFRYLTHHNHGEIKFSILPNDRAFKTFQKDAALNPTYTNPIDTPLQPASVTTAELRRLLDASTTRRSFIWRDDSKYNDNWSSHIDFTYVSDDYYLRDFSKTINKIADNQLLQLGELSYKSPNWNFIGRVQAYQTLHPIDGAPVDNNYMRLPQFILIGDYPDQKYGLEYFINTEITRFDIRKTPGTTEKLPEGTRLHIQPGVSLPLYWPYFYINPRLQLALTQYNLNRRAIHTTTNTIPVIPEQEVILTKKNIFRSVPIFDIASGSSFNRDIKFFNHPFLQTLEPQVYYVYIPFRQQRRIPTFDTTVNTLINYDQIFNYNRFTGIDRIGDANQMGIGITTRLIDQETGWEKVRLGVGVIKYFADRRVTLCNYKNECTDNPDNPHNNLSLSPISAVLNYHINPVWSFNVNSLWNPITRQLDNATLAFQYLPDEVHLINFAYTYARGGDILSGVQTTESINNLKVTDVSAAWPIFENISVVGRWTQNWNREHLQNLIYGLQYDTCCWAMRIVGGRAFAGFDTLHNNKPLYTNEISIQFSLKGLGDVGTGNPAGLLRGIAGYRTQFGQEL